MNQTTPSLFFRLVKFSDGFPRLFLVGFWGPNLIIFKDRTILEACLPSLKCPGVPLKIWAHSDHKRLRYLVTKSEKSGSEKNAN